MLEVRSLEKSFGSKQVLFGIDFQARPGRILGLVGKNGAGKTTIFHSILKFLEYQGEIGLDGQDIRQETYARIGYLPEERSLMPKLTPNHSYLSQLDVTYKTPDLMSHFLPPHE
ncbi:ATP-binding cassette domain-containing protein, partial [Streptococcus pneumoniae]